jgi:CheY-like chemotaxis protein
MMQGAPPILVVCTDLLFSTKITGTAKALGRPFAVARSLLRLEELLAASPAPEPAAGRGPLVIVDLNSGGIDPLAAVRTARAAPCAPRIVAFLSHVQADLAAAARTAGADRVMARSAFSAELPALIEGEPGAPA